jgi:Ala-tRNA(Pro) deacylase
MLGTIVDYLHNARVPFRLASYSSEEARPIAAHPIAHDAVLVETKLVFVGGRVAIVGVSAREDFDLGAVSAALRAPVTLATSEELPHPFRRARGSIPPLGQLFGIAVVLGERIANASVISFRAFAESDYFDIAYDDYARLEQPRLFGPGIHEVHALPR